jgi:DNA-binding transcriptional MerR regulator
LLTQVPWNQDVARPELLDLLDRENQLLDEPSFSNALEHLSEEQRLRILRPHVVLQRTFAWPLKIKEAAQVLGDVTEHQLRDWDDAGICRAARWGKGRYRGYFRSQLLLARLIRNALAHGYGVERLREDLGLAEKPAAARDIVAVVRAVAREQEPLSA